MSVFNFYCLKLSYPGGGKYASLLFFLHDPKTAQGIKLKLSDFKDTLLRHILQIKPVCYVLSCCHSNKITEGTSQDLAPQKSEKSAICRDIELKFGIGTNFGPLSSKTILEFQSDVNFTSLWRFQLLGLFVDKTQTWRHCAVIHQNFTNFKIELKRYYQ